MTYANYTDVEIRMGKEFSEREQTICNALLEDVAKFIDRFNANADAGDKKVVSCRAVMRAMATDADIPIGATQGSMSALGYSQSWTTGNGASGEIYLSKADKQLLGGGNFIGASNPYGEVEENAR